MRKPSPTTLVLAVSIALFAQVSFAQSPAGRASAGPSASAPASARGSTSSTANSSAVSSPNATSRPNSANGLNPQSSANSPATLNSLNNTGQSNQSGSTASTLIGTSQGVLVIGTPIAANAADPAANTANLQSAQLVDQSGRVLRDANGQPLTLDGRGLVGVAPGVLGTDSGIVVGTPDARIANGQQQQVVVLDPSNLAGSLTLTPELDRATRKELAKAKSASRSRNKQLLYSIAPRTNADRSDEVRDDPLSPALSTPDRGMPRY